MTEDRQGDLSSASGNLPDGSGTQDFSQLRNFLHLQLAATGVHTRLPSSPFW
jgi:hypothetical protein